MSDPSEKFRKLSSDLHEKIKLIYREHEGSYNNNTDANDFCDILIKNKLKAIEESKEAANYLTENNCSAAIVDLMIGIYIFNILLFNPHFN